MHLQPLLIRIGLNEKEAQVYMACLEYGARPASILARKSGLKRPSIYGILDGLIRKGFISQYTKSNIKYFSPVSPDYLLHFIEKRKRELTEDKVSLEEFIPTFLSLANSFAVHPHIRFFEGVKGIEHVMEDTLKSKTPIACISSVDGWFRREDTKQYIKKYVVRRMREKKIPLRVITFDTPISRRYADEQCPDREKIELTHNRWFPKHIKNFNNEINIYDNKATIVCLGPDEFYGVIIESREFTETMRILFEFCWNSALPSRWE